MIETLKQFFDKKTSALLTNVSTDLLDWIAVILLHMAFVPTYLMMMSGYTDRMPPLDTAVIIWITLALMFLKALIQKNMANIFSIGLGFILQLFFIGFIFFS